MPNATEYKHIYLLPGIDGTGLLFGPLTEAFGYRCRTTVLPFQDEVTLDDYIESTSARLPKQKVLLLAESFSGPIALGLMAKNPGRFRAAILSTTFARSPFGSFLSLGTLISKSIFGNTTLENLLLNKFCSNSDIPENVQQIVREISADIPPEVIKKRLHILDTFDARPFLPRISASILYLAGLRDRLVTANLRAELFENIPKICFKGIDGPHLLLQTRAELCTNTIMNFLDMEDTI
ncbi:MAG: alpha/beta hydrolase [Gammaproteobacteria bacterium]|nr:alpha/beta hydrolase [Gammaproteobacteria bacterium]